MSNLLADLEAGRQRAAWPDASAAGGWRVDPSVKEGILALFLADNRTWSVGATFHFADRATLPTRDVPDGVRVVPGGTTVRAGAYLAPSVVVMPPSYVNIGAWVGAGSMVDSHVLVGSCAQIGERVHLSAGVQVGGVLEPAGARPVIVEDGAFVGSRCIVTEGAVIGEQAILGAGVVITASIPIVDVTGAAPVEYRAFVPPRAVVVPGVRQREFPAGTYGLPTPLIVGWREEAHDLKVSLNDALREHGIGA